MKQTPVTRPRLIKLLSLRRIGPNYQAYQILHAGLAVAPIVAGVDKFTNRLAHWEEFLAPGIPKKLGMSEKKFMRIVGAIEILAGVGVAMKPRTFSYLLSAWLGGIIANLMIKQDHYDIALRDLGLSLGALALGRLSHEFNPPAKAQ